MVEFFPWVYSIYPGSRRSDITHVTQGDWDEARRIIEYRMTAEGREVAGTDADDIRAMLGALYLITDTGVSCGRQASKLDMKYIHQLFSKLEKHFDNRGGFMYPPPVIFTPAVSRFRNTFDIAHPTYCQELGPTFVDWYSASMAFMGVTHNLYDSTEGCELGKVDKSTKRLRDILITQQPTHPTERQREFNMALRELVSTF
jgi:hypothetical protein